MGNKYWLLKVTINDISVIHVTAHRCAGGLKKLDRYFVAFLDVPVKATTRGQPFYGYSKKPPHLVAFYDAHWDTEDLFSSIASGFHKRCKLVLKPA